MAQGFVDALDSRRISMKRVGYAIDDNLDAMDVDDAISYERRSDGTDWVHVHVADVGGRITPGSVLDRCPPTPILFYQPLSCTTAFDQGM